MTIFRELLVILGLTALGGAFSLWTETAPPPWSASAPGENEVTADEAAALDPIWIDARGADAYRDGHIPGAVRLTEDNWNEGLPRLMDKWLRNPRPIVVYCDSPACGKSRRIAERLRADLGDAEIHTLYGGWEAWRDKN